MVMAALSGIYYLSLLYSTENPFEAITQFMMAALVGYVALIAFNQTITKYLANTIANLKIKQVKLVVKESCGKEIDDEEARIVASKANSLVIKKQKRKKKD